MTLYRDAKKHLKDSGVSGVGICPPLQSGLAIRLISGKTEWSSDYLSNMDQVRAHLSAINQGGPWAYTRLDDLQVLRAEYALGNAKLEGWSDIRYQLRLVRTHQLWNIYAYLPDRTDPHPVLQCLPEKLWTCLSEAPANYRSADTALEILRKTL